MNLFEGIFLNAFFEQRCTSKADDIEAIRFVRKNQDFKKILNIFFSFTFRAAAANRLLPYRVPFAAENDPLFRIDKVLIVVIRL